jgi:hypothetical protein
MGLVGTYFHVVDNPFPKSDENVNAAALQPQGAARAEP